MRRVGRGHRDGTDPESDRGEGHELGAGMVARRPSSRLLFGSRRPGARVDLGIVDRRPAPVSTRSYGRTSTSRSRSGAGTERSGQAPSERVTLEQIRETAFGPPKKTETAKKGEPTVLVYRSGLGDEAQPSPGRPSINRYANVNRADLALLDPATGAVRRLTADLRPRGAWFSPDGSELAFTDITGWAENTQQPQYDLYAIRLSDGGPRSLGRQLLMAYGISVSWSPDGKSLAYIRAGQLTETRSSSFRRRTDGSSRPRGLRTSKRTGRRARRSGIRREKPSTSSAKRRSRGSKSARRSRRRSSRCPTATS
jgi:hypothetical protein